jgi:hypothetical protein
LKGCENNCNEQNLISPSDASFCPNRKEKSRGQTLGHFLSDAPSENQLLSLSAEALAHSLLPSKRNFNFFSLSPRVHLFCMRAVDGSRRALAVQKFSARREGPSLNAWENSLCIREVTANAKKSPISAPMPLTLNLKPLCSLSPHTLQLSKQQFQNFKARFYQQNLIVCLQSLN